MILPSERLPANIARIRPLVCMRPLVYQQIITFRELSVAKFTYKLFFRPRRASGRAQQPTIEVRVHLRLRRKQRGRAGKRKLRRRRIVRQKTRILRLIRRIDERGR